MIIKAKPGDLESVKIITQSTIDEVYPHYYPTGAVEFFKKHHSDENILKDINAGLVYLLENKNNFVGTVTVKENNINRLFVLPEFQKHGFGRELIEFAEGIIFRNYSEIKLDASLPAKSIYMARGYTETEYHIIKTDNGDFLCYDVMVKSKGE
ncbi:MAG: GNAT family N-acetyltransferase [Clostridia bacterium]|nr:GNAT family N-acetyltransferase [Clostridia bacterium]